MLITVDAWSTEDGVLPWSWQRKLMHSCWNLVLFFPARKMLGQVVWAHPPKLMSNTKEGRNPFLEKESRWESPWYRVPVFSFSGVFIVLKKGGSTVMLSWPLTLCCNDNCAVSVKAIITIARWLVIALGGASWHSLPSLNFVEGMRLDVSIYWCRREDGKSPISHSSVK